MNGNALGSFLRRTADDEGKKGNDPFYGKGFVNALRASTQLLRVDHSLNGLRRLPNRLFPL